MPNYRHVVRMPYGSNLPEDVSVNVWHSHCINLTEAAAFNADLVTFYNAIDANFASVLNNVANSSTVTTYDLADPNPRAPKLVLPFSLTVGASTLPPEVSICLSFQGAKISGESQARRRGRVYLGPWSQASFGTDGRPTSTVINAIDAAATTLLTAAAPGTDREWCIYSPSNQELVPVTNGWIDNEADTIRSRGRVSTTRTLFP